MDIRKVMIVCILAVALQSGCRQVAQVAVTPMPTQTAEEETPSPEPVEMAETVYPIQSPTAAAELAYPAAPTETPYTGPTYTPSPTWTPTSTLTPGYTSDVTLTPPALTGQFRLPAPLYYLYPPDWDNPDTQVWRVEQDGMTRTQITHEAKRVRELDVAEDGRLAYISDNDLIVTEANGGNRKVLIAGGPYPENRTDSDDDHLIKTINNPVWSPDGQSLAIGWNGVKVINLKTGGQIQVSPENQYQNISYKPLAWTPSGSQIVIWIGYYEGGAIGIARPAASSPIIAPRKPVTGPFTGPFTFLTDGQLLFGNEESYSPPDTTALWVVDPQPMSAGPEEGVQEVIILDKLGGVNRITTPKQAANGRIYFFINPFNMQEKTFAQLAWIDLSLAEKNQEVHRVGSFGVDPDLLFNLLWSPDGSLAVYPVYRDKLVVIRTADGEAFMLDVPSGASLHWGANLQ